MGGLFRRCAWRRLRQHKLRAALTVLGVALGVATMISIGLLHESLSRSYARTIDRIAGRAALQITNGDSGVPEELLDEVRTVRGVEAAGPSVQGFLPLVDGGQLYVFGVDLLADAELRVYGASEEVVEDPLVFIAQPDSVGLTDAFLRETGREVGDRVDVRSPSGRVTLTIRATLDGTTGPAAIFGGRLAVMDVFAAQRLFRLDRRFTEIDVVVAEDASTDAVRTALERVIAGRAVIERPRRRGEVFDRLIATNRYAMTVGSALALVIGLYLIFNMMMIGVAERRRDFALLRLVGIRRAQVLRLVAFEALLIGGLGSALGVPLGLWMASSGAADFALAVSGRFLRVETPAMALDAASLLLGVGAGCAIALLAALVPAAAATRVHPLEALRAATVPEQGGGERSLVPALVVVALSGALWWARSGLPVDPNVAGSLATVGVLVGLALAAPACVRWLARRAERPLGAVLGSAGALASRSIVSNIARVARTCSTFLVSLAGALAIAAMMGSLMYTLNLWIDDVFGDMDLVVTAGDREITFDSLPFPDTVVSGIRDIPGVRGAEALRFTRVPYEGSYVVIAATDRRSAGRTGGVRLVEGDAGSALARVERGEAVIVNEPLARGFGKTIGDVVTLASPEGPVSFPIAGIYFDFQDLGEVRMDRAVYRRIWRDETVSVLPIALEPGADRARVIEEIRRRWGGQYGLFVLTTDAFRAEFAAILADSTDGANVLVVIAIGIALLGLVNALAAAVLDRTREFALLRIVGATRRQVVRLVVLEAAIVGALAGVLGVAAGSLLGQVQVDTIVQGMLAMTVVYSFPARATVVALVASALLAAGAGYLPGRSASRLGIAEGLGCE